jgi:hypothetical protein
MTTEQHHNAVERLRRLADADPNNLPQLPALKFPLPRSRVFNLSQVEHLIREALQRRDAAVVGALQPDLRTILAYTNELEQQRDQALAEHRTTTGRLDTARAQAEECLEFAREHRAEQGGFLAMSHACNCILAALDGEQCEPPTTQADTTNGASHE